MYNLFLKKNAIKLSIFMSLSNHKKLKNSSIEKDLNISRTTLNRLINNLNDDLLEITTSIHIKQNNLKYLYMQINDGVSAMTIFHKLKLNYLKKSPHFSLLTLLVTSESCWIGYT